MTNPARGRQPAKGLVPRPCEVCGTSFEPYRKTQTTCQRNCREKLPRRQAIARTYHARDDVRERKNGARRIENNPGRVEINLRANLSRYGLTPSDLVAKLTAQGGRCMICRKPPNPVGVRAASRLHVDHDHVTGKNRDLLCNGCNRGIGYLMDDPSLLRAAADYIERHRSE
jgi:hypothetical protein